MLEEIKDDAELDQVGGGTYVRVDISKSFNTGGTSVGNVDIHAYKAGVSVSIGSSGGLFVA